MLTQIRWCAGCQDDQVFEAALCDDVPEGATAELCCALCGLGVYDSEIILISQVAPRSRRTRAA